MKIFFTSIFLFVLSISVFAQFREVSIMDIQRQDSILIKGVETPSSYVGDTLSIVGVVMVAPYFDANPDSGTTLVAGAPALILQDTSETDWAGILVRFPSPTADFQIIDTGMVIRATGVVVQYYNTTEFDLISFEASDILEIHRPRPQPVKITLDSLADFGTRNGRLLAARWESVFIEIDGATATSGGIGTGSYEIFDDNNTQVVIGNQGTYFRNASVPLPGTLLGRVKGYIQNRDNVSGTNGYANLINPTYPGDVEVLVFPPSISNITRDPGIVGYGTPVNVSADIVDPDGTVSGATLIYHTNMDQRYELTMSNTSGDTWEATIPALNDSSIVDYFISAVDNSNNRTINPSDTVNNVYFYLVLNRDLTIQDVQYSPFGGGYSGYNGFEVTIQGVVTADTSDINGNETGTASSAAVYMQNGTGPWSGIRIFGTDADNRVRGDNVTVTGPIFENYGVTQIGTTTSGAAITLNSSGNLLPEPKVLSTSEIDGLDDGTIQAEQWEGVLIKYDNVTVTDENADGDPGVDEGSGGNRNFGDILVADTSDSDTRVDLQDGQNQYHNYWLPYLEGLPIHVQAGNTFEGIEGILWYSFGEYKLIPRRNDDFTGYMTDVKTNNQVPNNYNVSQNYPNPFNPSTKIQYTLPVEGNVILKVYNILGKEVKTLIANEYRTVGKHTVTFDAHDLPSGVYFYRLQAGNFISVKKMILLK
jgi:hypothetical protein